jgi:hypothetical protein
MTKSKVIDTLIIILFYIGISALPFSWLFKNETVILIFRIVAQLLIFFLIRLVLKKSPLKLKEKVVDKQMMLWFIPVFLVCFSNYFNLFVEGNYYSFSFSLKLVAALTLSFFVAFNEEYIFRMVIIDNLDDSEKPIVKVVISAAIFGVCHLTHFFSSFNPADLIIVVYTFAIGMVLGMMYVYTHSFWYCVLLHFLYNSINGDLANFIIVPEANKLIYYVVNLSIGLIVGLYLLTIYFTKLNKSETKSAE